MSHKLTTAAAGLIALASLYVPVLPSHAQETVIVPVVPSPAEAETVIMDNCIRARGLGSCVTTFRRLNPNPHIIRVPGPASEQELAEQRQRDKQWEEHCKPTIRQDRFGVGRYSYAASGCEFGRLN